MSKLESRSEVCYFVGYPKETKGWYFYHPREQKVFVSTHAVFLEDDYIMNYKSKGRIVLEVVKEQPSIPQAVNENTEPEITATPFTIPAPKPRRSGWIVRQPDWLMFLEEAYEAVLKECESDLSTYEETMVDVDLDQ